MKLAVLGLGTMGCGIAEAALRSGLEVRCADQGRQATEAGLKRLRARVAGHVEQSLVRPQLAAAAGELEPLTLEDCCAGRDVVIEAVPEDIALKRQVLAAAYGANPGGLLATNSSSLPIDDLAGALPDASRFLGIHFFNPAEWVPGVEVVRGARTAPAAVQSAIGLLALLGKTPVVVPSSPGYVANRLQLALFLECVRCVEEGLVAVEELDAVVTSTFGFRLGAYGPFRIADMAGLDVYSSILHTLESAFGDRFAVPERLQRLVASGAFGVKTGAGFSSYPPEVARELQERRDATFARLLRAVADPAGEDP